MNRCVLARRNAVVAFLLFFVCGPRSVLEVPSVEAPTFRLWDWPRLQLTTTPYSYNAI